MGALRNSKVITYVTSDRPNLSGGISADVVPVVFEHLEALGPQDRIDLFVYSRGGDTTVPLRLVDLLREYAPKVGCCVPFRAHSAATMICLGADEILMGPLGELGPVDPTTNGPFNPDIAGQRQGISVEDVASYFGMAREVAGLGKPEYTVDVLKELTDAVHPLALGNVQRIHKLIRRVARELLSLHMDPHAEKEAIDKIVEVLTEKLYSHAYPITRREARKLGLKAINPAKSVELKMWELYVAYERDLKMRDTFDVAKLYHPPPPPPAAPPPNRFKEALAFVESGSLSHGFVLEGSVLAGPPGAGYKANVDKQTWEKL